MNQPAPRTDWLSIAQLVCSLFVVLASWGLGGLGLLLKAAGLADELGSQFGSMGIIAGAVGLLALPSTVLAAMRLLGKPVRHGPSLPRGWPMGLLILLAAVLWAGSRIAGSNQSWLFLPGLHVLAIGLPIVLLVWLGSRSLPSGSPQRKWGLFDSGLILSPALILVAELALLAAGAILVVLYLALRPELTQLLTDLAAEISQMVAPDAILEILAPYLVNPTVIAVIFGYIAVAVPLVEELLKPIGMWFLFRRIHTPAAGFTAGLLCGAGYALFESLSAFNSGEEWLSIVLARGGTAVIHITTTGLVGWALARAWRERRYLQLGLTYLAAVIIHGTWNAMTVTLVLDEIAGTLPAGAALPVISNIAVVAPLVLGGLAVLCVVLLITWNRRLRPAPEASSAGNRPADTGDTEELQGIQGML